MVYIMNVDSVLHACICKTMPCTFSTCKLYRLFLQYRQKRLEQEKEQLNQQVEWLNKEVNTKSKELMNIRTEQVIMI